MNTFTDNYGDVYEVVAFRNSMSLSLNGADEVAFLKVDAEKIIDLILRAAATA